MGWRAELVGRRIRERRQQLGWPQEYLAYVLTDISGTPTTKVDVSRRERGVRELTVDQLFLYALALDCGVADLLVDDDGYAWVTPRRPDQLRRARRARFREGGQGIGLTPRELRAWLANGVLPPLLGALRRRRD